eukprot:2966642-Pyramimonas_sp.AAC.1
MAKVERPGTLAWEGTRTRAASARGLRRAPRRRARQAPRLLQAGLKHILQLSARRATLEERCQLRKTTSTAPL